MFVRANTNSWRYFIIAYTQNPRENVDADIHVSSGDRGLNSTAIYHLHSYFTLTSLYHYTDFPESRVLVAGQCNKYQTLTYWLIFNIKHAKVCASKISLRPIITLSVRPSVH